MEMPHVDLRIAMVLESKPLGLIEGIESRGSTEEKIMGSYKHENVNTVGVSGLGVGMTRMARRIGEKVETEKLFKSVVVLRVGPNCEVEKILYELSYYLGVRVELGNFVAKAKKLLWRLIVDNKILIILDDIRKNIDIKKIGIPLETHKGSGKSMTISRSRSVCLERGAKLTFSVQGLTEKEMWILLREKAGDFINSTDFRPLAKCVFEKCGGLPLAITFAARMLKELNKSWPGGVVEANHGRGLSYDSRSMEEMVTKGSIYVERGVIDMLNAEIINASSQNFPFDIQPKMIEDLISSLVFGMRNHDPSSVLEFPAQTLFELDLQETDIEILPTEIKKLNNLRLLNLTNCRHLQTIEAGLISSLVCLEELYMLGSFNEWEAENEGEKEKVGNASIKELELLPDLIALQIQVQDLDIIPKSWCTWTRLAMYIISTPRELKCRLQESLDVHFPAVDWKRAMLRNTECLHLAGDGSKNAVNELIPEGFKPLKKLEIGHCSTIEYLVSEVDRGLPKDGIFPILESLSLEELPLFTEISHNQSPVGFFRELRNLKLSRLPALLHVYRSPCLNVSFSNLKNVYISHCPKLRSLFPLSTACSLRQLEEIKVEYCEVMEVIISEEEGEDCGINKEVEFLKLNYVVLRNLPNLIGFCQNERIEFPELRVMSIRSLTKLRTFCPTVGDLHYTGIDDNHVQFLFNEKITFGSLKKLEVVEVVFCDALRSLFTHSVAEAFVQLKHLIVEHCSLLQEVIRDQKNEESFFPQLKILELRRLPKLESFYYMINGLELPSLEELIIHDCPRMKEFCGGRVNMPMLKYVKRDYSVYRIDGISYTVQCLFNEKGLFVHQAWPVSSKYQGTEVEVCRIEEVVKESSCSHPKPSNYANAGISDSNLQYDMKVDVYTKEEALEACLCDKHGLKKIELDWSSCMKGQNQEEIIECLQPPKGIQELRLLFYKGRMLPSWISNPSFEELVSITLKVCRYCNSLPSLGELPSLKCLQIYRNEELIEINGNFCRKQPQQANHWAAFPKLEKLTINEISKLEKWTGIEKGDFPCLKRLHISDCPKLVHLPFLSHLSSLSHMSLLNCAAVSCLPVGGLPTTLKRLRIDGCPKLEVRCRNEQCEDWSKVAHVPTLYINNKKILDNSLDEERIHHKARKLASPLFMDQSDQRQQLSHQNHQPQQPPVGVVAASGSMSYPMTPNPTAPMVTTGTPAGTVSSPTSFSPQQLAYHQQAQHFHSQEHQQQFQALWANQMLEIDQTTDFKNHSLPPSCSNKEDNES